MLRLTIPAFHNQGEIPGRFTCQGEDISPELQWSGAPLGTKSFALVLHDPDAPREGGFTHWVVYNIPAHVHRIPEHAPKQDHLPSGGIQGNNDYGERGYRGPCPPSGTHRYYFHLYALDNELHLKGEVTQQELEKVIQGHILAQTAVMGTYKRSLGKNA